jgi:hypothetical protein
MLFYIKLYGINITNVIIGMNDIDVASNRRIKLVNQGVEMSGIIFSNSLLNEINRVTLFCYYQGTRMKFVELEGFI